MYSFSLKESVFAAITRSILMSLKIFATQPNHVLCSMKRRKDATMFATSHLQKDHGSEGGSTMSISLDDVEKLQAVYPDYLYWLLGTSVLKNEKRTAFFNCSLLQLSEGLCLHF